MEECPKGWKNPGGGVEASAPEPPTFTPMHFIIKFYSNIESSFRYNFIQWLSKKWKVDSLSIK